MSTTSVPAAASGEPAKIGAMGRVIGVLTSPAETFADIARKPSWLMPVILLAVLGCGVAYTMNLRIDWYAFQRHQMEMNPRASSMSAEQMNQQIQMAARISPYITYVIGILGALIFALVMALVYWGAFNLFAGANARFKQALGVAAHSLMTGLISSPLLIVVLFLKERGEVEPENMLVSSASAFLGSDAPRWLVSLAGSFELFWFWTMFLLAAGFAAINPKKLTTGKAMSIVVGVWLVWVFIKVGGTYAFTGGR